MELRMVVATILKIIIGLVIFIFFTMGLSSTILLANYTKAIKFTFFNKIKCADVTTCVIDPSDFPIPDELLVTYSKKTAEFTLDLINRVTYDKQKDSVKGTTKVNEIYNDIYRKLSVAVIWESAGKIGSSFEKIIWIAIRGTDSLYEWMNNFKISQKSYKVGKKHYLNMPTFMKENENMLVHNGFLNVYDQIYPEIMETLSKYDKTKIQVCLAGHSLGGYIVGNFALKYPEGIKKILLLSPVGYRPMNDQEE